MYPHLLTLCDCFLAAGWDKIAHYKTSNQLGHVSYRWKHSSDWSLRGTKVDCHKVSLILAFGVCFFLLGLDVLASVCNLSGKYFVTA